MKSISLKLSSVVCLIIALTMVSGDSRSVRLRGGVDIYRGRVEVFYNGTWGTVCDDGFSNEACVVVCRQIGFGGGVCIALPTAVNQCVEKPSRPDASLNYYPDGATDSPIWLSQVTCVGVEQHLFECRHGNWGQADCRHKEDVGCRCMKPTAAPTTVVNGHTIGPGPTHDVLVEQSTCDVTHYKLLPFDGLAPDVVGVGLVAVRRGVFEKSGDLLTTKNMVDGIANSRDDWGFICDDTWDDMDAAVVCSCLGFTNLTYSRALFNVRHEHRLPFHLDEVHCSNVTSRGLTECPTVLATRGRCSVDTETAAVACVQIEDYTKPKDVQATVACDGNAMRACLKWGGNPTMTSSRVSPACVEAVKQTEVDGFCYTVNMATCPSVNSTKADDHSRRHYCYDVIYDAPDGFIQDVSMRSNVTGDDVTQSVGLRLRAPFVSRRFCCDVVTMGNSVSALLQPLHGDEPELRQVHEAFNFTMSCFADATYLSEKLSYPAAVKSGDLVSCRVEVTGLWDEKLLLVVPNCTFSVAPYDEHRDVFYQFIHDNCPQSNLLDIKFRSFGRASYGFQTRVPKFDQFRDMHVSCVAVLCNPLSNKHHKACDRSCGSSRLMSTASREQASWVPMRRRQAASRSPSNVTANAVVGQGPFLVEDSAQGLLIKPDGSLWTESVQYLDVKPVNSPSNSQRVSCKLLAAILSVVIFYNLLV